jgi:hypothetical protein
MGSATQPVAYGKWGAEPLGANRTIEGVGCYITSWAMLLDYWGGRYNFHTNPYELNRWLKDNGGYSGNDLNMGAAARYAKAKTGRKFYEARSYKKSEANDRLIDRLLDDGIPVILEVSGHFVIAVGKTSINGVRTWYINDPLRGNPGSATSLYATLQQGYSNQYISLRWGWEAPSDTFYTYRGSSYRLTYQVSTTQAVAAAAADPPLDFIVTDPQGRRTGRDPRTGATYDEIPGASLGFEWIDIGGDPSQPGEVSRTFTSTAPLDGGYTIQVIGAVAGSYRLDGYAQDNEGQPTQMNVSGQLAAGQAVSHADTYDSGLPDGVPLLPLAPVGGAFTVNPDGGVYPAGTPLTLTPQPNPGQLFVGWTIDGVKQGWSAPLTLTMDVPHVVQAHFVPIVSFSDVGGGRADYTAITALATRGTIRGYGTGNFGPDDGVQRAQMAALIARATPLGPDTPPTMLTPPNCLVEESWDCEAWGTNFTDPGGIDPNLWRNAGALQHYQVAFGYTAQDCQARGRAFPCYGPTDPVSHAQTIAFISRAMIAKGYWQAQLNAPLPYSGVPGVLATEVRTFHYYAGTIQAAPTTAQGWNAGATRGWFALALWAAHDSYFGVDRVP